MRPLSINIPRTFFIFVTILSILVPALRAQVYETLYSFTDARVQDLANFPNKGRSPRAALVRGTDGSFYGTTRFGGPGGMGTVFKMTPDGTLTTLVNFTGNGANNKGSNPLAALVQGSDGNFYGTTKFGGAGNDGTVFKMTPSGVLTTLVEFTGANGLFPEAALVQGNDGNFYGTTSGTVFKMTPGGVMTTLVAFNGSAFPKTALVRGSDGNFYGTTEDGGTGSKGTVFKMTAEGLLTTLVEFTGNGATNKGSYPRASLIQGSDGNFYGTTSSGGAFDRGTVFKMTTGGALTTLINLSDNGATNKGSRPESSLLQGSDGNFYGTTLRGGTSGGGTIFRMTEDGVLTTLLNLIGNGSIDLDSRSSLVQGFDGNFYGTTEDDGEFGYVPENYSYGYGTVFKVTPAGVLTTLVNFSDSGTTSRGRSPEAALTQGSDGDFYGTTLDGGAGRCGTIFKINSDKVLTTLVEFSNNGATNKGSYPKAALIEHSDGTFYGTTRNGGVSDGGTVFKMTPAGVLTTLVQFGSGQGYSPWAGLVRGPDGSFYGTTKFGGAGNNGTVFKMTPSGGLTILLSFTDNGPTNKGREPEGTLVLGSDGNLYGTTNLGGFRNDGTVFKMTPAGDLTTLVEFDDDGMVNRGRFPSSLIQQADGNFYGTTASGGTGSLLGEGTIFKMTLGGILTTLVDFTGSGGANKGSSPRAPLLRGSDGNYYGSTLYGGVSGNGTVFKMTSSGVLTTLWEFSSPGDGVPYGSLIRGTDGNLYGTTGSPDGNIYRILFPGAPLISSIKATPQGIGNADFVANINARGSITSVVLDITSSYVEDRSDMLNFPDPPISVTRNLTGFVTTGFGIARQNLAPGTIYHYRFRAMSSAGTTVSPVQSFSTLAPPLVTTASGADPIELTSVRLNGTVNAQNYETTVVFEWGTNGNSFPNRVPYVNPVTGRNSVTGNSALPVSMPLAGLLKNTTYSYRVVATNAADTVISGSRSFTTLTEPTATVATPTAVTSHSVVLNGFVNPHGSETTSLVFEYGTDRTNLDRSIGATPSKVTGEINTPVSANLSNIKPQGATYYYRIKATSAGGVGNSSVESFSLNILSGFARVFPQVPPQAQGSVLVTLTPSSPGGWRFAGEQLWRPSGVPAVALTSGDRSIEFRPVPGYIQPPSEIVSVVSGGPPTLIDRVYYETPASGIGGLRVSLEPAALAAASVPVAERAQWRLLGEGDSQWRDSDAALTGLFPGTYLVECKPVAGRSTPPTSAVLVQNFETATPTLTYFLADALTGTPPSPVQFGTVTTDTPDNAYAHVGQIRSNVGSSSGFVVKQRVVATAGHVVFDDGTLSAVTGLQWLFQRQNGIYEPKPQTPRGFYLFDGYASARSAPGVIPGEGTTPSKNLDVAALYFVANATTNDSNFPGRGGFGGFLASDSAVNEFLTSPARKILVGYPVDGISPNNQGLMHATAPMVGSPAHTVIFAQTFDRTYVTSDIRGSGGMSGGPLCVLSDNGNYYPAAVYLGGTGQTVVRSIDSQVIDMFNRAENSGNNDSNNTGGGITLTGITTTSSTASLGAIRVTIVPAEAASAARWGLKGESSSRQSGQIYSGRDAGDYILQFTEVSGFQAPAPDTVRIVGGKLKEYQAIYVAPRPTITSAGAAIGTRGQSLTYQTVASPSPSSYSLTGSLPAGLTFNTSTGLLSGELQQAGVFIVTLGATNPGGTGSKTLVLTSRPAVDNQSATGVLGQPLNYQSVSSEGATDVNYAINDLPPGAVLNESTGLITGTPTQTGVFSSLFTVNKEGASASAILTLTTTATPETPVNRPPSFSANPFKVADGTELKPYAGVSIASTAIDPDVGDSVTFTKVSGPSWLTVAGDGGLFGTPPGKSAGSNRFTIRATDHLGAWAEATMSIEIKGPNLPPPWSLILIGNANGTLDATYKNAAFNLESKGSLNGMSDTGAFVWQTLSGDGQIVARVQSIRGATDSTRAGIMIRDSLAAKSRHVFIGVTGKGEFCEVSRSRNGANNIQKLYGPAKPPATWVKLVRKGNTITSFTSNNGKQWTQTGTSAAEFKPTCYVGLLASGGNTKSASAEFRAVKVSP